MSGTPISKIPPRKSFAQVAAAAAANRPKVVKREPVQDGTPAEDKSVKPTLDIAAPNTTSRAAQPAVALPNGVLTKPTAVETEVRPDEVVGIINALQSASMEDKSTPPSTLLDGVGKKDNSDAKSIASRTTLTLDEKESLRPDDSASMQAAVEEDAFTPPESVVANSGQCSDPDAYAFRAQLNQIGVSDNGRVIMPRAQRPEGLGLTEQHGGPLVFAAPAVPNAFVPPQQANVEVVRPQPPVMWVVPPDEKLLEALASPKDRLFVLKVEQDLIDFIKDPKEEFLQLPGTNSFYRMLSHKLADYYMLGHIVDDTMSSVRIFRNPLARLPPPLIGSTPGPNNSTPPPSAQARKIMTRNRGSRAAGKYGPIDENFESFSSSKATSDVGSGGEESKADKGALTREEREDRYKAARARIFKDFEVKENGEAPSDQNEPGQSRSSSTSGVKKNKKQRRPKDDGFEARSAFDPYGRRLSEHAFTRGSPDGAGYEQFFTEADRHMMSSNAMLPNGQGFPMMGYGVPNGGGPINMSQWPSPGMPNSGFPPAHYSTGWPTFGHDPYAMQSSAYESGQFSPQMTSDSTPKGKPPTLSGYNQGFLPHNGASQMGWSQEAYMNSYATSPMFKYAGYGGDYTGFYGAQVMQPASPGGYGAYPPPSPANYNQPYSFDNYDAQQSFNPRSQAFVPSLSGGGTAQHATNQNMRFMPNPVNFPPQQRPQSNTINQASYHGGQYAQTTRNKGSNETHATNGGRQQAPQQSSIAKWAAPATLPPKPPQPANGLPQMPMSRESDNQPLPPKPISIR